MVCTGVNWVNVGPEPSGPCALRGMPYWKYAVVARPSGFTNPENAAPFGPVTVGAPVITGDGGPD